MNTLEKYAELKRSGFHKDAIAANPFPMETAGSIERAKLREQGLPVFDYNKYPTPVSADSDIDSVPTNEDVTAAYHHANKKSFVEPTESQRPTHQYVIWGLCVVLLLFIVWVLAINPRTKVINQKETVVTEDPITKEVKVSLQDKGFQMSKIDWMEYVCTASKKIGLECYHVVYNDRGKLVYK